MSRSCLRVTSPAGASNFTTSAPSQARICVHDGPDWTCVISRTRTPSSAFPKTVPLLVDVWVAPPHACASRSDHTLISDRLPDPAQLAGIEVVCEGCHSAVRKVTDITRRTVYLIQSGRKTLVSCQFPGGPSIWPPRPRILPRSCGDSAVTSVADIYVICCGPGELSPLLRSCEPAERGRGRG